MTARIAIILHRDEQVLRDVYLLAPIARVWRELGLDVSVCTPSAGIEADIAILHVDLTVLPDDHVSFARRFPAVLNGTVLDISKRRISRQLVSREDDYSGPVVVKTDRNSGGYRESAIANKSSFRRSLLAVRRRLPWTFRPDLPSAAYRVFESSREVPRVVWRNRTFVVERFLTERQDGLTCLRTWVFLGDRETMSLVLSPDPIVKSRNVVKRIALDSVPDELRAVRREMGFDFGKFDYAIVDGRVVLYDVNRTPWAGPLARDENMPRVRHLAQGIRAFL
jgi:hypothetical protein